MLSNGSVTYEYVLILRNVTHQNLSWIEVDVEVTEAG